MSEEKIGNHHKGTCGERENHVRKYRYSGEKKRGKHVLGKKVLTLCPMAGNAAHTMVAGNDRPSEKTIVEGHPHLPPYGRPSTSICVLGV